MVLAVGQVLRGQRGTYRLLEALKASAVFKAEVLPGSSVPHKFVVIKTRNPSTRRGALLNEKAIYDCFHRTPLIKADRCIRSCYDLVGDWTWTESLDSEESNKAVESKESESKAAVEPQESAAAAEPDDPPCMVLEWMDSELWDVPSETLRARPDLIRTVARSMLLALLVFSQNLRAVNTDIHPHNVLVSGVDGDDPTAKIGDLGEVYLNGYKNMRLQTLQTRAPEVWKGHGCHYPSDVWALGVTLAHSLVGKLIFGNMYDKIVEGHKEGWCIAKIFRLVGYFPIEDVKEEHELDFLLGKVFASETFVHPDTGVEQQYMTTGTLREELAKVAEPAVPSEVVDFLEYLLVLDPDKRPTATEALTHPFLRRKQGEQVGTDFIS